MENQTTNTEVSVAAITLKENDVYNFRYNVEETKKRFEPYHCFDGTLLVKKDSKDNLFLCDMYWGSSDNRTFTLEKAIEQGTLIFLCNLDEMVDIKAHECIYYDDKDIVYLHIHAGYNSRHLIKKGTQRSQEKMPQSIKRKINKEESNIRYSENSLISLRKDLLKIEGGDTSVYL